MTRKITIRAGFVAIGAALALGAGLAPAAAQQQLNIGFIAPTTGFLSQTGQDMVHGFQMYLNDHNGMLGGAKVNLIIEDSQAKPNLAVTKARQLILDDHVDMFIGGQRSPADCKRPKATQNYRAPAGAAYCSGCRGRRYRCNWRAPE